MCSAVGSDMQHCRVLLYPMQWIRALWYQKQTQPVDTLQMHISLMPSAQLLLPRYHHCPPRAHRLLNEACWQQTALLRAAVIQEDVSSLSRPASADLGVMEVQHATKQACKEEV